MVNEILKQIFRMTGILRNLSQMLDSLEVGNAYQKDIT